MTGDELLHLELGDRVTTSAMSENAISGRGKPMRWASFILTANADHISTQAIYARYPIGRGRRAGAARYQRRYLIDGRTRGSML